MALGLVNKTETIINKLLSKGIYVFILLWVVLFILYLPAAKAGFIEDFLGWVTNVTTMKFWDYVNRTESHIASLYQFTQVVTYLFYQVLGKSNWGWHILHITLQATNGLLLFLLFKRLFSDAGIKYAAAIAFGGVLLYCVCPHISEVIIWEPAYHYLQGLLLILLILLWVQRFQNTGQIKYAWFAAIVYFLSTFSLEVFYITPWLAFTLIVYYRVALQYNATIFRRSLLYFFVPQMFFFVLHLALLQNVYHIPFAHIGQNAVQPPVSYLQKPAKYLYNVLFFGRYFPEIKHTVYLFLDSTKGLIIFYTLFLLICISIAVRFKKMTVKAKTIVLFFCWTIISMSIITPLMWQDFFIISYERYTYVLNAFIYITIALLISYITIKWLAAGIFMVYALINVRFTLKADWYWKKSAAMMDKLIRTFPNEPNKTVLLLNLPECLNGAPLIGAQPEGGFKIMTNLLYPKKITNNVYDVMCYNLIQPEDGAHVMVLDDSTIRITLNQWGTWWQYQHVGGHNYENKDFRVDMKDMGHMYEVVLKKPAGQFLLLYSTGDTWHMVDWNKKNVDQN